MQILACDKSGYFEMYKQTTVGSGVSQICIGSTCIGSEGYAKSTNFPICTGTTPPPACTPSTEVCDQQDNDCDGQIDENNVCGGTAPACYTRVQDMPLTCDGTVTQDTFNGCRQVVCTNGGNSIQILACDKPSISNAEYFEMYKQSAAGTPPKVCLGPICMQYEGFKQSGHYPICVNNPSTCTPSTEVCDQKDNDCDGQIDENNVCTQPPACTPTTEVCDQKDNDCDAQIDEGNVCAAQTCYNSVQNIPATCEGSTISSDTWSGGRTITCGDTRIQAWDKSGYFEMYKQAGGSAKICIGQTCIKDNGYAKSTNFPICTSGTPPTTCTPTTEVCDQQDNDCDGQIDENNVCTSPPTNTCYNKISELPASCSGTLAEDTVSGTCRKMVCTSGSARTQVLACDKSGFFEMYKQEQVGAPLEICLASTCIKDAGYTKSSNYPLCTGTSSCTPTNNGVEICDSTDNNCNGQIDENNVCGSTGITWLEPTENQQSTSPNFFHLNVQVPSNEASISRGEWEVWNSAMTERVWYASNTGNIRFHTHAPDGAFQGSLAGKTQLNYATTYKVRTRWHYTNGTIGQWSSVRTFTTSQQTSSLPGAPQWTVPAGFKVERFATGLDVPVHVVMAPDRYGHVPESQRPYMYVTELYGKVKVIYRDGSSSVYADNLLNFEPFGSITGGGQMGVIGLFADTNGDVFVGMTYVQNDQVFNKVMRFTSSSDGRTAASSQTIISGLPSSPSHQVEFITKGPDGKLYVGLGDALNEQNAQSNTMLAGRIIRMNTDGSNVETYAKGLRNPFGADWRPGTSQLFATDNSPNTNDRLLRISQGGNYLWGQGGDAYVGMAIDLLNPSPVDVEFNPGNSGFPSDLSGKMYVAVGGPIYAQGPTNGKEILEYTLDGNGNIISKRQFMRYTGSGYGTPIGLEFGSDGLYFTDIYGEPGFVGLGETEGNIYRISPGTSTGGPATGTFRAGVQVIPWYPKDTGSGIEYIFECNGIDGSGNYYYHWNFGNGQTSGYNTGTRVGPIRYPYGDQDYTVTCRVEDRSRGGSASASMVVNPSHYIPER